MKKLMVLALLSTAIYSCGPSAEEKEKMEQARQDSMKAAEDMMRAAEEAAAMAAQAVDTTMMISADTAK